ncbi:MAG: hypothetical protein E3J72_20970 [Planctomycetota bacterium]|nr:MAG: hypothetical protein E3J72_20970 [Planctomycetota bacterium]
MRSLLNQIEKALKSDLYYVALFVSLSIPDICGALESDNGEADRKKYMQWFDKYVAPKYYRPSSPAVSAEQMLTGEDCYHFRCSALHQGSSQKNGSRYSRYIFLPRPVQNFAGHCNVFNNAFHININTFCMDITESARKWLEEQEGTDTFKKNYNKMMREYPDGIEGIITGIPIIS